MREPGGSESKSKQQKRIEEVRSSQVSVLSYENQSGQQNLKKKWQESWIYNQLGGGVFALPSRGGFIPKFPTTTTLLDTFRHISSSDLAGLSNDHDNAMTSNVKPSHELSILSETPLGCAGHPADCLQRYSVTLPYAILRAFCLGEHTD
jgi:hypothetical protein